MTSFISLLRSKQIEHKLCTVKTTIVLHLCFKKKKKKTDKVISTSSALPAASVYDVNIKVVTIKSDERAEEFNSIFNSYKLLVSWSSRHWMLTLMQMVFLSHE